MRIIYELKKSGEFKSVLHSFNGLYTSELNAFFINISSDSSKLWFLYPLAGWGIGIVIHALTTFPVGIFGKEWEERKIKEYMEKDK